MQLEDDTWIARQYPTIAKKLHALGVVSVAWNEAENWLLYLFGAVAGLTDDEAKIIAHDMGDISLSDRIKAFLKLKKASDTATSVIENALAYYDLCRRNRNQLTHFVVTKRQSDIDFERKSKKLDHESVPFANSLEDVRRVAEEIHTIHLRLFIIVNVTIEDGLADSASWPAVLDLPTPLYQPQK